MSLVCYDSSDSSENETELKPKKNLNKLLTLPTYESDEEDEKYFNKILKNTKKQTILKNTNTKSGLTSLLPKPKIQSISNSSLKSLIPPKVKTTTTTKQETVQDDVPFFSFIDQTEVPLVPVPVPVPETQTEVAKKFGYGKYTLQPIDTQTPQLTNPIEATGTMDTPELEQLITSLKRKRPIVMENIIDINQSDLLGDVEISQSKRLTEEADYMAQIPSSKFSGQEKRKHQMTYLAYQAKERELELKNQWAANRASKRETRKKYGF